MERDSNTAGGREIELSELEPIRPWFGFARSNAVAAPRDGTPKDRGPVTTQEIPEGRWTNDHVDRLLNTAPTEDRDTSGLVPVISIADDAAGNRTVTSLRTDAPRFQERLDFRTPPPWNEGAGVALGASRAMEKAHSLGLRHGALQPSDVVVAGSELAVAGMGLSLGGTPEDGLAMAPEVAQSGVPTVPGDVYSLGLLLQAGTENDPSTPEEVKQVIADATTEDVGERIPSALAFSERLSEAGGDVMRTYTPMGFADSPLLSASAAGAEPVAAVAADPEPVPTAAVTEAAAESGSRTGKILPWIVGAGLAGVVGFGLWAAATGSSSDDSSSTTVAPTTVTTASTTTTPSTTEAPSTTTPEDPATTSTTSTTTSTTSTTVAPPPPDVPATPIEDAGFELLHGLSDPPVDAYLDGELLVAGFEPGQIAGPLALEPGDYDVQLFAATDDPAPTAADRDDDPIVTDSVRLSGAPETVIVGSDGADGVALSSFSDDLSAVPAGEGRISLRNPTDAPILASIDPLMDGDPIERQIIAPGAVFASDLPAGDYRLFIAEENGDSLLATVVSNTEGEVTAGTFLDGEDPRMIFQRIGGLGTPPDGIPTGTSGLLPGSNDPVEGLLIAAVGSLGLFALIGRERFRRSEVR